ncbi:Rrf2 family protein [Enterococcus sp. PF1-24]|uniref:RrF2 family transcriptional regulator n=1 Tax=unclassified Enterococcus TaxID=2608891 RepID=UPI002476DD2F|nr:MULTISPECIES: Rrf2 family transcriptional regulator [unclassified Enterococcus]MDH6364171.1 Rrf2 family protein [Enterococcus sp. PFB1-1]MDH6401272.1 Rrf2 family protein [Enterococcus sp. PF1-24]
MSYSTATFQATSILLYIHFKTEDGLYDFLSTRSISEYLSIPNPTAVKILNKLRVAGLIHTKEGAKGGNLLTKSISEISMLEVFTAVEQDKPLFKIQHNFNIDYENLDSIVNSGIECLNDAEKAMKESLSKKTLLDLIK